MRKMTVFLTSEEEARHLQEVHDITFFVCAHAWYWGQDDMTMKSSLENSTESVL